MTAAGESPLTLLLILNRFWDGLGEQFTPETTLLEQHWLTLSLILNIFWDGRGEQFIPATTVPLEQHSLTADDWWSERHVMTAAGDEVKVVEPLT